MTRIVVPGSNCWLQAEAEQAGVLVDARDYSNRSMGLDSELNLAWEAADGPEGAAMRRAIRRLRVSLLAEHAGLQGREVVRGLARAERLVAWLDDVAAGGKHRLRLDSSFFESMRQEQGLFATGFRLLTRWFSGLPERPHPASLPAEDSRAEP